jgi:enterochelin esterase family protein
MSTNQAIISPRIAALQRDVRAGNAGALEDFWREVTHRATPLIESVDQDNKLALVTFLWRDADSTANPALICSLTFPAERDAMTHIPQTDVWFKTYQAPRNALDTYQFAVGGSNLLDPLNSRVHVFPDDEENSVTGWKSSILELPNARPQPWSKPVAGTPTGEIALHRFQSRILGEERRVWIYKPSHYSLKNQPYGLLVVFDGWFYLNLIPVPTILDNLVAARRIAPMVGVLIGSVFDKTRDRDLACYPPYFEFVTTELIPWARDTCHVTVDPHETVVAGASSGGLAAAFAGLRFPDIFGNILSNSGSFGWKPDNETEYEWISRQYAESPRLPLQFYLDAGCYELWTQRADKASILLSNRHLRDVLKARGYPVHYQEFSGGHNPTNWHGTFADGLLALMGNDQSKSKDASINR